MTTGARPPFGTTVPGNDWSVLDGTSPAETTVSVIVVHYEQHDDLERTLRSLARQTHPADRLEVIVVDDGSTVAPRVPAGIRLIVQEDRGFRASAARNAGAAAATGDVLVFLDADTSPEPGYVAALVRLPALAPETVTVGRRRHAELTGTDGEPIEIAGPAHALPEPSWLRDAYAASRNLLDSDERSYRYLIGAVLACSRWFFAEVGGFDESFTTYGGEDWEWAHRAWIAGAIFAHEPDAVAWHNGPDAAVRQTGSPDDGRTAKNRETLALLNRIAVPGASGRGLATGVADVVVVVPTGDAAAVYRCVDTVLQAMPTARLIVDPSFAGLFGHDSRVAYGFADASAGWRTLVEVRHLFSVRPDDIPQFAATLATACTDVGRGALGTVVMASDSVEIVVTASRAARRAERWGAEAGWTTKRTLFPLVAIGGDQNLAGYLGGWGD